MKPIQVLARNIAKHTRLSRRNKYLITKAIRVRPGVRLYIQDGTEICILNGPVKGSTLHRAALIFEPGSQLRAGRFSLRASNLAGKPVQQADNGGVWFCGNSQSADKDNISITAHPRRRMSKFTAHEIRSFYLGRPDSTKAPTPKKQRKKIDSHEDLDALSVLGVGRKEWEIKSVQSFHSGDDGFDLTNSDILLHRVSITNPTEDGLNISSSRIQIIRRLSIQMGPQGKDRDLFDLETDQGGSYIEISKGCQLRLEGVFGDQVILSSADLPALRRSANAIYRFSGTSRKADSLIYSITED